MQEANELPSRIKGVATRVEIVRTKTAHVLAIATASKCHLLYIVVSPLSCLFLSNQHKLSISVYFPTLPFFRNDQFCCGGNGRDIQGLCIDRGRSCPSSDDVRNGRRGSNCKKDKDCNGNLECIDKRCDSMDAFAAVVA